MPTDDRIFDKLESIEAQIRSMQASMNSNNVEVQTRLTTMERDFAAHIALDEKAQESALDRDTAHDEEIEELSLQLGKEIGKIGHRLNATDVVLDDIKKVEQQALGAKKVLAGVMSVAAAALVLLNIWHVWSH